MLDNHERSKLTVHAARYIAELEEALKAIASRDVPHPNGDWSEVDFAADVCRRLGIAYETQWDR